MARFYARIKGNKGAVTRLGTEASGIYGLIQGWRIGVSSHVFVDDDGRDTVSVSLTSGSNGGASDVLIATFKEGAKGVDEIFERAIALLRSCEIDENLISPLKLAFALKKKGR